MKANNLLVSMSLYGTDAKYQRGAVENAKLMPSVYPGWTLVVYCNHGNPAIPQLLNLGAEVFAAPDPPGTYGMFWRFLAAGDPSADAVIFRDADSLIGPREAAAVEAWLNAGTRFHVMRDHPDHANWPILGGMWGVRGMVLPNIRSMIASWSQWDRKLDDMRFLSSHVWPLAQKSMTHHSSVETKHPGAVPFPPHGPQAHHVGQIME